MQSAMTSRSGMMGTRLASSPRSLRVAAPRRAVTVRADIERYDKFYKQFRIPEVPVATVAGIAGWMVPAASPAPAFGGRSLLSVFTESIGAELAHFPTGPALDSPFWLYLVTFHVGLFLTMTLGTIGVAARKQGYFD